MMKSEGKRKELGSVEETRPRSKGYDQSTEGLQSRRGAWRVGASDSPVFLGSLDTAPVPWRRSVHCSSAILRALPVHKILHWAR